MNSQWRMQFNMLPVTKDNTVPIKIISPEILIQYHKMGFKVVPLLDNHVPVNEWTPIYDNPNYWNVKDFEDPKICSKFKNVATTFGKTHIRDSEDRELYLQALDLSLNEQNTNIDILIDNIFNLIFLIERYNKILLYDSR